MAHECIHCGSECYCRGDYSDSIDSETLDTCEGCGCEDDDCTGDLDLDEAWDDEDDDEPWLCGCGQYITNGLHCSSCGNEPPWGCPCSMCSEPAGEYPEEWEYPDY